MARPSQRRIWTKFQLRLGAAGAAALVFTLGLLAASPALHGLLHDPDCDDGCAVAVFSHGVSAPPVATAVTAPNFSWTEQPCASAREPFLTVPRYLHQPERGPPSV